MFEVLSALITALQGSPVGNYIKSYSIGMPSAPTVDRSPLCCIVPGSEVMRGTAQGTVKIYIFGQVLSASASMAPYDVADSLTQSILGIRENTTLGTVKKYVLTTIGDTSISVDPVSNNNTYYTISVAVNLRG